MTTKTDAIREFAARLLSGAAWPNGESQMRAEAADVICALLDERDAHLAQVDTIGRKSVAARRALVMRAADCAMSLREGLSFSGGDFNAGYANASADAARLIVGLLNDAAVTCSLMGDE